MVDHAEKATEHLDAALADGASPPLHLAAAGVHAILYLAETIRHGIRDIVYELRD